MKNAFQFKINFTGGIVSPGFLLQVMEAIQEAGIENVRFGLRQQLLIDVPQKNYDKIVEAFDSRKIVYEINTDEYPNIISSYAAEEIFVSDSWLREGVYKDIFDLFDYRPKLKLNFSDNNQTFTPFFTGNINWIASASSHFWYLFIRFPKTEVLYQWPQLIYTNDLPRLSKLIEDYILENKEAYYENPSADGLALYNGIMANATVISKAIDVPLNLPAFNLPYYEGFNSYGNKTWLGIYRRDELFPVSFVKDIANICLQTKIGQLYTTTWKSLIIKNIEKQDRNKWDFILGKYRINVRHAANELAWQVEDNNEESLSLKRYIIREFDKQDVRTFGLCFAAKISPDAGMFGSVIVQKRFAVIRNVFRPLEKYDILYTNNFNPNSKEYITYRDDIHKEHITTYLISIAKHFYELQSQANIAVTTNFQSQQGTVEIVEEKQFHQCSKCFSIYDEEVGEPENNIASNTAFIDLPDSYCCPLCEAGKEEFVVIKQSELNFQSA